jgi:hypothetical protein
MDIAFIPGGKMSLDEYKQRMHACTKEQVTNLLVSPEYKRWVRTKGVHSSNNESATFTEMLLVVLALFVVMGLLAGQRYGNGPESSVSMLLLAVC